MQGVCQSGIRALCAVFEGMRGDPVVGQGEIPAPRTTMASDHA